MTITQNTHILFSGKTITIAFQPTEAELNTPDSELRTQEVRVRQIPIRDYERGFTISQDEIALAGFLCCPADTRGPGAPPRPFDRAWALSLTPESYEAVLAAGREVNERGFFAFAARRADELEKKQNAAMLVGLQLAQDNPGLLELAMKNAGSASPAPSLASPPRPAA